MIERMLGGQPHVAHRIMGQGVQGRAGVGVVQPPQCAGGGGALFGGERSQVRT